jgi:hypothetical protein
MTVLSLPVSITSPWSPLTVMTCCEPLMSIQLLSPARSIVMPSPWLPIRVWLPLTVTVCVPDRPKVL